MRLICSLVLAIGLGACVLTALHPAHAQVSIGISIDVEPPPLPIYAQPVIPASGYMWVPGYWAWSDDVGYYWIPGTWVLPPDTGLLWTPGYWGWNDGAYVFYAGYWGPHIGFYGGVNYGFGYTSDGYEGGYWRGGNFFYNTSVNNVSNVSITNVYTKTVVVNNTSNVSYNGGAGGTTARPTPEQLAAAKEHHVAATPEQTRHAEAAAKDPALSLSNNHGHPAVAATPHPGQFKGPGIIAARPGKPIEAQPLKAPAGGNAAPVQGVKGDRKIPTPKGSAAGTTTGPGSVTNEKKPPPGPKPLERQTAKPIAPAPRPAPPPPPRQPPPAKPKCPPGQHCG